MIITICSVHNYGINHFSSWPNIDIKSRLPQVHITEYYFIYLSSYWHNISVPFVIRKF